MAVVAPFETAKQDNLIFAAKSDPHYIDSDILLRCLKRVAPASFGEVGKLRIGQFAHGQSNPTFLLVEESGRGRKWVLRKQPPGELLRSAHDVVREYRALSHIQAQSKLLSAAMKVPSAEVICLVEDTSVLGTKFYIQEFAAGIVHRDAQLRECSSNATRTMKYLAAMDALAALHSVPIPAASEKLAARNDTFVRLTQTWMRQHASASKAPLIPAIEEAGNAIIAAAQQLKVDGATVGGAVVTHGDFKMDNIIFRSTDDPRIEAVVDYELTSVGSPLSDIGHFLMPWFIPAGKQQSTDFLGGALLGIAGSPKSGVPHHSALLARYLRRRGLPIPSDGGAFNDRAVAFSVAFSLFKMAAIAHGVKDRALKGNASSSRALEVGAGSEMLARLSMAVLIRAAGISPDRTPSEHSLLSDGDAAAVLGPACPYIQPHRRKLIAWLHLRVSSFVEDRILPVEALIFEQSEGPDRFKQSPPLVEELKTEARKAGLWNLFLPSAEPFKLRLAEYAPLCEIMGRSPIAPECFNCSAPDTGNMEVLHMYGNPEQQKQWLEPLMRGEIRSVFAMTEPDVASSDPTQLVCTAFPTPDGNYIIRGDKWWSSGAGHPNCKIIVLVARQATASGEGAAKLHALHSIFLVPFDSPGVEMVKPLRVFGTDDAPFGHCHLRFNDVVVPKEALVLGHGRGFEVSQGRLGPGRVHHCMRLIGLADRAQKLARRRALVRTAFGQRLANHGTVAADLAENDIDVSTARLLVLDCARRIDEVGARGARKEIAAIKAAVPRVAIRVVDRSIQIYGGAGVCPDETVLPMLYVGARTLRIADGPDDVHLRFVQLTSVVANVPVFVCRLPLFLHSAELLHCSF